MGGAIGAVAIDVLYLAAIVQQGSIMPGGRVPFVAAWIAIAALLAGVGALTWEVANRSLMLAVSASAMLVLAVPGAWSVGIPLFICAMAVGLGAAGAADELRLPRWLAVLAPLAIIGACALILLAGFALTHG
ncbi:MAG: hypothetical protein M3R32_03460 [Chloroflexota bacterium]|nr:hypothetical protein [Chloroflexota bacterium]